MKGGWRFSGGYKFFLKHPKSPHITLLIREIHYSMNFLNISLILNIWGLKQGKKLLYASNSERQNRLQVINQLLCKTSLNYQYTKIGLYEHFGKNTLDFKTTIFVFGWNSQNFPCMLFMYIYTPFLMNHPTHINWCQKKHWLESWNYHFKWKYLSYQKLHSKFHFRD